MQIEKLYFAQIPFIDLRDRQKVNEGEVLMGVQGSRFKHPWGENVFYQENEITKWENKFY